MRAQHADARQQRLQRSHAQHHVGAPVDANKNAHQPEKPERDLNQQPINQRVSPQLSGDNSWGARASIQA